MIKEFISMSILKEPTDPILKLEDIDDLNLDNDNYDNPCGGDPLTEIETIKPNIKKIFNKKICYKCKVNPSNFLNRTEYICKDCFLKLINHKFRSNLRAHCKIKHEDYVLVCISGGNNSMAMLHWFYSTFNDNTSHRKLFFKLKILYVDDSILFKLNNGNEINFEEARKNRKNEIENLCIKYNFSFDVLNLENSMSLPIFNTCSITSSDNEINLNNLTQNLENEKNIENFLHLYKNISRIGSFHEDFLKIMTRNLIFYYALKNNFTKIVFAESSQALVNTLFNQIVKGRGFSLREDIGYIDNHFLEGKINILKPMRDFLTKEILLYNKINNVDLLYSPKDLMTKENLGNTNSTSKINLPYSGNTNNLVKFFFDNLQDKMSSTITTVMGTAEKLKVKEKEGNLICGFCLNYIDEVYNELEIGTIDAINNDKIFSTKNLCFGCKRMFQNLQDDEELLKYIPNFYEN